MSGIDLPGRDHERPAPRSPRLRRDFGGPGLQRSRRKRGLSRPNWKARAQVWTWASKMRRPVHHDQNEFGAFVERRPDVSSVAGAEDRLRQDERDAATVLVDELTGEREELHRRVGVRAAAATARAAASRRRRHLRQEGRVADHEVEPLVAEVVPRARRLVRCTLLARSRGRRRPRPDRCRIRRARSAPPSAPLGTPRRRGTGRHRTPDRAPAAPAHSWRGRRGIRSVTTWSTIVSTSSSGVYQAPSRLRFVPSGPVGACDGTDERSPQVRLRRPTGSPGEPRAVGV